MFLIVCFNYFGRFWPSEFVASIVNLFFFAIITEKAKFLNTGFTNKTISDLGKQNYIFFPKTGWQSAVSIC